MSGIVNPSSGTIPWTDVTGTSQTMSVNNGYIADNASLVTLTLPVNAAVASVIYVTGFGAGGWRIAQNASQQIFWDVGGNTAGVDKTTNGTGGRLDSTDRYDCIGIQCVAANNTWVVMGSKGNITLT